MNNTSKTKALVVHKQPCSEADIKEAMTLLYKQKYNFDVVSLESVGPCPIGFRVSYTEASEIKTLVA